MLKWLSKLHTSSKGWRRILLRVIIELLRRLLLLLGDRPYYANIHGREILLPVSHKLPIYIANYPYYDKLPMRLADHLRKRHGFLSMIDIGANVGDTILACVSDETDKFLGVELNPGFIWYLEQNCKGIRNFTLVRALCSSRDASGVIVQIDTSNGTSQARNTSSGIAVQEKKLDTILAENPHMNNFNFLKIDTDGGDFDVIFGAQESIRAAKPAILFECDHFNNPNYVLDYSKIMELLRDVGYEIVIAYDNLGYLLDVFKVENYTDFKFALFHQLISDFGYFDLLILTSSDGEFLEKELSFFSSGASEDAKKNAMKDALSL
jgi:FkbM family methyltransferase